MSDFFDMELALRNVKSKRTQDYLKEVLSTYNNMEYRSCIVMLYATTFADALEKIKILSDVYQNKSAETFLEQYENDRKNNVAYSTLERKVKDFIIKSGLINDVESKQWDHLKDYRDYCAHPVVGSDYQLISPNAEQVRMHIRNMFDSLFLKDAILTDKKVFDEFINKLEDYYDRNGFEDLEEYTNNRYIKKLDLKTKGKFIKDLWKFAFGIDNDECNKYRAIAYRAMIWIIQSDSPNLLEFIRTNISYFDGQIKYQEVLLNKGDWDFAFYENRSLSLIYFLYMIPEIYSMLSPDNQTEIRNLSRKNINVMLLTPYLYNNSQEHVEDLISNLRYLNNCLMGYFVKDLCERAYKRFDYEYNELLIYYFFNCQNSILYSPDYVCINSTYTDLLSYELQNFTRDQLVKFVEGLDLFYVDANCFSKMANQIVNISKGKGYNIDFSVYTPNLNDYIDEQKNDLLSCNH